MKTFTTKMLAVLLSLPLFSIGATATVTHGSMKGTNVPLYEQGSLGGDILKPVTTATLDYKVVTKDGKTWAYLKFTGTAAIGVGADWESQLRYWSSSNVKTENNLTTFRDATQKVVMGKATKTIPNNPLNISFFQNLNPGGFSETLLIPYDITAKNSSVTGDVTIPEITACDVEATEISADLTLSGSDDSGDLFYYIVDAEHGIEEFALSNFFRLSGLSASTNYNLTITPIDFNGNEGTPLTKSFRTAGFIQVTYGIAKDIKFRFKSTASQLEYYYEFVDSNKKFRDAALKITPAGGTEFEVKPTLSPDSTYVYGVTSDTRIAGKVLSLNCCYLIYKAGPINYEDWVVSNSTITDGELTGTPIKHQMGGAIYEGQLEGEPPVLNDVKLIDATPSYIKLNIDGSDNSGALYYVISGAKQTVNAFRTGNYYLTAIEQGKLYTLNIVAKDFSGNSSASTKEVKVKTMNIRSNITDNTGCAYNTTTPTTNPELVVIIQRAGSSLTIGCTTASDLITAGEWKNREFNNPTVKINGTSYPLSFEGDASYGTTATTTFTGNIGSTPIEDGLLLTIQWSVFWGQTGGGNFLTGMYNYVIGDDGQPDITGPFAPDPNQFILTGNTLSWPAWVDDLSGVKYYNVVENDFPPVRIFDLGESSFSYTMSDPNNAVTITAVDFVNNSNSYTKGLSDNKKDLFTDDINIYPNPAKDVLNVTPSVYKTEFYTLEGQLLYSVVNIHEIPLSTFNKGMYVLRLTDKVGNIVSKKLVIQ